MVSRLYRFHCTWIVRGFGACLLSGRSYFHAFGSLENFLPACLIACKWFGVVVQLHIQGLEHTPCWCCFYKHTMGQTRRKCFHKRRALVWVGQAATAPSIYQAWRFVCSLLSYIVSSHYCTAPSIYQAWRFICNLLSYIVSSHYFELQYWNSAH